MFSLRDTIASALLGVQITSVDSSNDSSSGAKKNKKKPHKKKTKKSSKAEERKAVSGTSKESDDTESEDSDDDAVADIGHFGASEAQSHEAKVISALVYQFESTQIGTSFIVLCVCCLQSLRNLTLDLSPFLYLYRGSVADYDPQAGRGVQGQRAARQ
jgi:hypothetical protein